MLKQDILSMMRESGGSVTGTEMGRRSGVSRAAVWKAIEALRQEGYVISSASGRGYTLESAPDLLTEMEITPCLSSRLLGHPLHCMAEIDSTNSYLKRLAAEDAPEGLAAVADCQTGGRGRQGRAFLSPAGMGVYLSVLLRPRLVPMEVVNLTAYVAVAVCDAVETVCGLRPGVKWPNDIILGERKICGILTELGVEGETAALQYVVTGLGVNCNQRPEDFPLELREVAGSIAMVTGKSVCRARLAAELLNALDRMYAAFPDTSGDYLARYRRDCLTVGREVRVLLPGREYTAAAVGIDNDFGLVLRREDGSTETLTAGEVSVRGLLGYI